MQLDRGDWRVRVVNRRVAASVPPARVTAEWFDLSGRRVACAEHRTPVVPPSSADTADGTVAWPPSLPTSAVGFLRLSATQTNASCSPSDRYMAPRVGRTPGDAPLATPTWYWLRPGVAPEFGATLGVAPVSYTHLTLPTTPYV